MKRPASTKQKFGQCICANTDPRIGLSSVRLTWQLVTAGPVTMTSPGFVLSL